MALTALSYARMAWGPGARAEGGHATREAPWSLARTGRRHSGRTRDIWSRRPWGPRLAPRRREVDASHNRRSVQMPARHRGTKPPAVKRRHVHATKAMKLPHWMQAASAGA